MIDAVVDTVPKSPIVIPSWTIPTNHSPWGLCATYSTSCSCGIFSIPISNLCSITDWRLFISLILGSRRFCWSFRFKCYRRFLMPLDRSSIFISYENISIMGISFPWWSLTSRWSVPLLIVDTWSFNQLTRCVNLSAILGPWTFNQVANVLCAKWLKSEKGLFLLVMPLSRYLSILVFCWP